jgi:hypothetical protein
MLDYPHWRTDIHEIVNGKGNYDSDKPRICNLRKPYKLLIFNDFYNGPKEKYSKYCKEMTRKAGELL